MYKYSSIVLSCWFILISSIADGQDTIPHEKKRIKINPVQLFLGEIRFLTEKSISKRSTLEGGISVIHPYGISYLIVNNGLFKTRYGGKLQFGYRFYFPKKSHLYINPLFFYKYVRAEQKLSCLFRKIPLCVGEYDSNTYMDSKKHVLSVQFLVGWQQLRNRNIGLEIFLGIGGRYRWEKGYNATTQYNFLEGIYQSWLPTIQTGLNISINLNHKYEK